MEKKKEKGKKISRTGGEKGPLSHVFFLQCLPRLQFFQQTATPRIDCRLLLGSTQLLFVCTGLVTLPVSVAARTQLCWYLYLHCTVQYRFNFAPLPLQIPSSVPVMRRAYNTELEVITITPYCVVDFAWRLSAPCTERLAVGEGAPLWGFWSSKAAAHGGNKPWSWSWASQLGGLSTWANVLRGREPLEALCCSP